MTNAQERDLMVERIAKARPLSQTQVDTMSRAAALAATNARISLAKLAAASTRMEIIEDKVIKTTLPPTIFTTDIKLRKTVEFYRRISPLELLRPKRPLQYDR